MEQIASGHAFDDKGIRHTTRTSKTPRNYEPNYTNTKYTEGHKPMKDFTIQDQAEHVLEVAMAQDYSLRKRLEEFGHRGKNAVQSELQPHHDMGTSFPINPNELSRQQKREALGSLMNLMQKGDGCIKVQCAPDGSKQRQMEGYVKRDATSPTVHNKSVFITAVIDTHEDRDVMILDTPGAFLHVLIKDEVIMLLRGPLAETIVLIDPYVTYNKNEYRYCM